MCVKGGRLSGPGNRPGQVLSGRPRFVALEDSTPGRRGQPICMICCFGGFAWGVVPLCRYSEVGAKDLRVLR